MPIHYNPHVLPAELPSRKEEAARQVFVTVTMENSRLGHAVLQLVNRRRLIRSSFQSTAVLFFDSADKDSGGIAPLSFVPAHPHGMGALAETYGATDVCLPPVSAEIAQ